MTGWRRGHRCGQDRLRVIGGLAETCVPISIQKIELIDSFMVGV